MEQLDLFQTSNDNVTQTKLETDTPQKTQTMSELFVNAYDLYHYETPHQQWLVEGLIPAGTVTTLVGPSDTGKSMMARQLAIDIALGASTFLNKPVNVKYGRAVYISTEDYKPDWKQKLNSYKMNEDQKNMLHNLEVVFNIDGLSETAFKKYIDKNPVDLIVIDALADVFYSDLNDVVKVRNFLKPYKEIACKYGAAIIFVHHLSKKGEISNKPNKTNVLGSQGIESASRSVLELRHGNTDDIRTLYITKCNYLSKADKNKPINLKLTSELRFEETGTVFCTKGQEYNGLPPVNDRIVELHIDGFSIRKIRDLLISEGYTLGKTKIGEIVKEYKENNDSSDIAA